MCADIGPGTDYINLTCCLRSKMAGGPFFSFSQVTSSNNFPQFKKQKRNKKQEKTLYNWEITNISRFLLSSDWRFRCHDVNLRDQYEFFSSRPIVPEGTTKISCKYCVDLSTLVWSLNFLLSLITVNWDRLKITKASDKNLFSPMHLI